jgi:hypothetical protein
MVPPLLPLTTTPPPASLPSLMFAETVVVPPVLLVTVAEFPVPSLMVPPNEKLPL